MKVSNRQFGAREGLAWLGLVSPHYGIRLVSRYLIWDSMICRKIQSVSVAAEEFTANYHRNLYLPSLLI